MRTRMITVLAASAVALLAAPATATAATTARADSCTTFGNSPSFGTYAGHICDSGHHVYGTYTDTKADGYCVFLRVHLSYLGGGTDTDDSAWACPKGAQRSFDKWYPLGEAASSVSLEKVYVP